MIKKIVSLLICAFLIVSVSALDDTNAVTVFNDGEKVQAAAYLETDTVYIPVRSFCEELGAEVNWTGECAEIKGDGLYMTVYPNLKYITANGRCLYAKYGVFIENGILMAPLRALATAFGGKTVWNGEEKSVDIKLGKETIVLGGEFYNADDLYWLSRIIHAEASGESFEGKIAVGNVVLNRVDSPVFPDSIYEVIHDRRYGIQFTPAWNGGIKRAPSEESVAAAKLCLEGENIVGASLYFAGAKVAASSWAGRNRDFVARIGNHCFYA